MLNLETLNLFLVAFFQKKREFFYISSQVKNVLLTRELLPGV